MCAAILFNNGRGFMPGQLLKHAPRVIEQSAFRSDIGAPGAQKDSCSRKGLPLIIIFNMLCSIFHCQQQTTRHGKTGTLVNAVVVHPDHEVSGTIPKLIRFAE